MSEEPVYVATVSENGHRFVFIVKHKRIPELFQIIDKYPDAEGVPTFEGRLAIKEILAKLAAYYAESSEVGGM